MIPISIEKIGAVTGGIVTLPEGDDSVLVIDRITEGLRYVADNDLYCCPISDLLSAQKAMILARLRGAAATLSEAPPYSNKLPHIQVPDYIAAIRSLARTSRERFSGTVIAVTGSCGKTTTKELLYAMLRRSAPCTASPESINALSAIPNNLLAVRESDRFAVLEAGINHTGEMEQISTILRPDVGIVTNIGAAHLEGLGSVENVLAEKLKIFEHSPSGFAAFLNGDDPLLRTVAEIHGVRPHFFHASDWRGDLPFAGEHFRANVAAAAAVARYLGVPEKDIEAAVREFVPLEGRCSTIISGRRKFINDSFNANPSSMRAALDLLVSDVGFKTAVLGDMLELGEKSAELHRNLGHYVAEKAPDRLICIGSEAKNIARGAVEAGFPGERILTFGNPGDFLPCCEALLPTEGTVLLKASHGMMFDRILEYISGGVFGLEIGKE